MTSTLVAELISKAGTVGTNLRHVTRELGIPDDKVKNWMRGTAEPSADEVKHICEKLGVDIPKTKVKTIEKTETPAVGKTKEREPEEKVTEEKPAKDDFMPKPELFEGEKPVEEDVLKAFIRAADSKFIVGEVPESKKEEKKMDETKNVITESPKEVDKPKRTRTVSPKRTGKKQLLSEESEAFVRKSAGLKKSEEITEKAVAEAFKSGMSIVKQKMDELARLEKDVTKALFAAGEAPVDDRLKKLLEAAEKASDEGIAVAITILEKFRK